MNWPKQLPKVTALTLIAAAFLCLGSSPGLAGDDSETYRVATGAVKDELWELAAGEFRALLRDRPDSEYTASATYYLGFCCFQIQDFESAERSLSSYLSRWPRGEFAVFAKYYLGRTLLEIGQDGRAKPLFEDVLSSKGELVGAARFWLGRVFFETGDWAKASKLFLEVVRSGDKEFADSAYYELGRSYIRAGRYAESIETARSLLERPIDASLREKTRLLIAASLMNLKKFDEAIQEASAITGSSFAASAAHQKALAISGEAYRMSGRPEMAVESFRRYLKTEPDADGAAWAAQSTIECLALMAHCREADESMLLWANRLSEESVCDLASKIADCYSASGDPGSGVHVLTFAMKNTTSDSLRLTTALKLADSHFKSGEYSAVVLLLSPLLGRGLLTQDKDVAAAALLMVGASHEKLGSLDEAERSYRLLLSLKPDAERTGIAADRLVDILVAKGDLGGALTTFNELGSGSAIDARFVNLAAKLVSAFVRAGANRRAVEAASEILKRLDAQASSGEGTGPGLRESFLTALSGARLCGLILELAEKTDSEARDAERAGLLFAAAECRFASGERASASTIYLRIVQQFPEWKNTHDVLGRLGAIAFAEGRFEHAAERFDAARQKAPLDKACDLLYMVAESLFRSGKLGEALLKFEEVVKRGDCRPQVLQNSYLKGGMICEELGRFEEARAAFSACASMAFDETATSVARARLVRLGG
ncbi:MAG: tetratricopeptide repeat protein [Candidatus Coatesbacteria bacterium]|nr:tetratricopeptide repeat protein [Candidatus Coatesbacteria bacterium]